MNGRQERDADVFESVHRFVVAGTGDELTDNQWSDFERLLREDSNTRRAYVKYASMLVLLPSVLDSIGDDESPDGHAPSSTTFQFAPLGGLGNTLHGTVGYFSSGWPVAYLVATVIFGIGLFIGSLMPASRPAQVAKELPPPSRPVVDSKMGIIGRITGMADCRWIDRTTAPIGYDAVPLGGKYALASGLLEITYDTGAKVLLQGPVTYEAESCDGGYLSVGKLTARVEKKAEGGKGKAEKTSEISLFSVRTPSATLTDLGTEFGVEVSEKGHTTSHVFRGSVRIQLASGDGKAEGDGQILRENQSARVEKNYRNQPSDNRVKVFVAPAGLADFVRRIPRESSKTTIKTFDLTDVLAGGDGFSGKRGRGIDPTTGRIRNIQPDNRDLQGDYNYHRVEGLPFVDGVFIPEGSKGPVQIDSAGHMFPDCPKTDNNCWAYVWAGGKLPPNIALLMSATLAGIDYSSPGHSLLTMHANKGLTFDLEAIRRSNPGYTVLRFRAVAGNTESASAIGETVSADIWVMVDGQVRFKRRDVNNYNGAAPVAIPIHAKDRFLTLAATDSGNSYRADQIIFGDPRLELAGPDIPGSDTK